jgi:hypothetical protein
MAIVIAYLYALYRLALEGAWIEKPSLYVKILPL